MIRHVFKYNNIPYDYLAGSATDCDKTLSGPEFDFYKPHIAVINGIAGDHENVLPDLENYRDQFSGFASAIMPGGSLLYYANDPQAVEVASHCRDDIRKVPYDVHGYMINKTRMLCRDDKPNGEGRFFRSA